MRSAAVSVGIAAVALIAVAVLAGSDERRLAFTLGVGDAGPVSTIRAGEQVCQRPLTAEADFAAIRLRVASEGRAELVVEAVPVGGGRPLASARRAVLGGPRDVTLDLDRRVARDTRFALCAVNGGGRGLAVHGGPELARRRSAAYENGTRTPSDLMLVFLRDRPRTVLQQIPEMFERAALFRPGPVGPWTFWLLLGLVGVGVPALLAAALRSAAGD